MKQLVIGLTILMFTVCAYSNGPTDFQSFLQFHGAPPQFNLPPQLNLPPTIVVPVKHFTTAVNYDLSPVRPAEYSEVDATGSFDREGDNLIFSLKQKSGAPKLNIIQDKANPGLFKIQHPKAIGKPTLFTFQLTVSDGKNESYERITLDVGVTGGAPIDTPVITVQESMDVSSSFSSQSLNLSSNDTIEGYIHLTNNTSAPITLTFFSQTFEIELIDDNNYVVARWSEGRAFRQITQNTTIEVGKSAKFGGKLTLNDNIKSQLTEGIYKLKVRVQGHRNGQRLINGNMSYSVEAPIYLHH